MLNGVAGDLIGPWYGVLAALIAGIIRNTIGAGRIFTFPGGLPGALFVGLTYWWVRRDWAALIKPLGTGVVGVLLIVILLGPLMGKQFAFVFFIAAFMASSIPGSAIGHFLLKALRNSSFLPVPTQKTPPG